MHKWFSRSLFLLVFGLFVLAPVVSAKIVDLTSGESNDAIGLNKFQEAVDSPVPNQQDMAAKMIISAAHTVVGSIVGLPNSSSDQASARSGGAVGVISQQVASMYRYPVADTQTYVADVLNTAGVGIVQPAYAQGLGFSSLSPILEAWKSFRDLAYTFFVIVFIVIGFMIMTRKKISGQAVVTAQQAIPKIIVALLTVTFSYAIAGLLIDAMYLLMYLLLGLFGHLGGSGEETFLSLSFFQFGAMMVSSGFNSAYDGVSDFIQQQLGNQQGGGLLDVLASSGEFLGGLTVGVIVAIAILFAVFALFFELLKTYISIIISIVLSPLILMMGALPGRNTFGTWIQGLIGNLMAFPTVLLLLLLFDRITCGITHCSTGIEPQSGGFSPPYLFGVTGSRYISFVLGLGMLLIMKEMVVQSKKAFGAKGGVFEQFGVNVADALKKGWSGGQLVPGLGFTDTNKLPYGGLSGKNVNRKLAIGAFGAAGAPIGAVGNLTQRLRRREVEGTGILRGMGQAAITAANKFGDPTLSTEAIKKRREAAEKAAKANERSGTSL